MRLRGYHSVKDGEPGSDEGILPNSYYYVTKDRLTEMHTYSAFYGAYWSREWPVGWHNIDASVGLLPDAIQQIPDDSIPSESFENGESDSRLNAGGTDSLALEREVNPIDQEKLNQLRDRLGTLTCDKFGGPSFEKAREMVYWQDIPSDAKYVSPFRQRHRHKLVAGALGGAQQSHYMVSVNGASGCAKWTDTLTTNPAKRPLTTDFRAGACRLEQQANGTRNNSWFGCCDGPYLGKNTLCYLQFESAVLTRLYLEVIPPATRMVFMDLGHNDQKLHFELSDFFPFAEMVAENEGLDIISMEQYLQSEAMTGKLRHQGSGEVLYPPENRTNWNGCTEEEYDTLKEYLRTVTFVVRWNYFDCLAAFPSSGKQEDMVVMQNLMNEIVELGAKSKEGLQFPVPVNGTVRERLVERLNDRQKLCVYNETMQQQGTIHFMHDEREHIRLLVHFYAYLFFEDWREDLWMKRFMRDHGR
jgi:hypothetical protein